MFRHSSVIDPSATGHLITLHLSIFATRTTNFTTPQFLSLTSNGRSSV